MDELLHQYVYTLHCLLNSWTESVHGLKALLGKRVLYSPAAVPQANEKEWEGFLASMELFFGQPPYRLKELLENARVTVYLENDTILAARHQQSEMLFVMEEVGLRVRNIRYYKNQPWAFSDTLMVGFFADLDGSPEIHRDAAELATAEWFTREDMPYRTLDISLTAEMIERFRQGESC